jgi:hypothetical protein
MVFEAARTANIRDGGRDGEAAANEAGATEATGNVGVAVIYQPEEAVAVNITPRRQSDEEMMSPDEFNQRLDKLISEISELRMKHELLLARCVKNREV